MASVRKLKSKTGDSKDQPWVCEYTDANGKRRRETPKTGLKKDAEAIKRRVERELERGEHIADAESVTVNRALDLFLKTAGRRASEEGSIREYTAYHWKLMADKHIRPFLGALKLTKLNIANIQAWMNQLAYDEVETRGRYAIEKALQVLRLTLDEMQAQGRIHRNVIKGGTLRIPGARNDPVDVPTKDDVKALLVSADGFMKPLLCIAAFAGLRRSELLALTWDDIDLANRAIHVRRSADRLGNFQTTKTRAGVREVPISPDMVRLLREWKLACPPSKMKLVFPSPKDGEIRNPEPVHQAWCRLQIKAGLATLRAESDAYKPGAGRYHLHSLRHFAASMFIETGLPPKVIQTVMGHASIQMTFDRYGRLFEDRERIQAAVAGMGAGFAI